MPTVTYQQDLTGILQANLITNEIHTVNESQFNEYSFIIPNFAPFYIGDFELKLTINGVTTILTEDIDYTLCLPYITGTRETGKAMYGGISLNNLNSIGVLQLTYRIIGGGHVVDRLYILGVLSDKVYNPRITVWDTITNSPAAFAPMPHYQDYDTFYGQEELVNKLQLIKEAIGNNAINIKTSLNELLNERSTSIEQILSTLDIYVRKDQLDVLVAAIGNTNDYIKKDGSIAVTGELTLMNQPSGDLIATNKGYVDSKVNNTIQDALNTFNLNNMIYNSLEY